MLAAIILISIVSISCKRQPTDEKKFKMLAIWFSIAVLIILFSIPWNVGKITANRPLIRSF